MEFLPLPEISREIPWEFLTFKSFGISYGIGPKTEQKFDKWFEAASECLNIEGFWSPVWRTKLFTWQSGVSITETKESIKTLLCKKSHMPSNFLESPKVIRCASLIFFMDLYHSYIIIISYMLKQK